MKLTVYQIIATWFSIVIYKILSNRILYIIVYIIYIQILFILLGSPIYCMDSDNYTNPDEVNRDSEDIKPYNKQEIKNGIRSGFEVPKRVLEGVMTVSGVGAVTDLLTGDPGFVDKTTVLIGSSLARIGVNAIEHSIVSNIEAMPDNMSDSRPPSPSIYDTDNISRSSIIDIEGIIEWVNRLEEKEKITVCGLITIACSIQLYIMRIFKTKIDNIIGIKEIKVNKNIKWILDIKRIINLLFDKIYFVLIYFFMILGILMLMYVAWMWYL